MKGTVKLQVHSNTTQQVYIMRECDSEIFTYLFYIYCYFKCTFLSPCVKGQFKFLCYVYWWIIKIWLIWFDLMHSFCEIHISVSQITTHHYSEDGLNWQVAGTDLGIHRCWHLQAWSDSCRNERGGIPAFHTQHLPSLGSGSLCSLNCCQSERRNPSHCNRSLNSQSEPEMTSSDENPKAFPDTNLKSEASHLADPLSRFSLEDWSAWVTSSYKFKIRNLIHCRPTLKIVPWKVWSVEKPETLATDVNHKSISHTAAPVSQAEPKGSEVWSNLRHTCCQSKPQNLKPPTLGMLCWGASILLILMVLGYL